MALHPSVAAVRRAVRRALADLEAPATVLVACSGGPDSVALLDATVVEGHRAGLRVAGATVDHGLQDGSAELAARVVAQMAEMGADETLSARVRVEAGGLGPEAAARRARYAVLGEMATHLGAAAVLLGHTRDDQAETVLLGLTRGSGGRSLAGMRRAFDGYRRPLLDVPRLDTETACQVQGREVWSDPHNEDHGYTRVRVRRVVLPVLEDQLGPGVAATLARTADQLRVDMDLLDDLAEAAHQRLADPADGSLPVPDLAAEPDAVRRRVLRLAALTAGAPASELFHEHVLGLDALVTDWHGQRWVDLPGHCRGTRVQGRIRVTRSTGPGAGPDTPGN
ncbi:tRNA lysidine(34) synthetase TilS [Nocardioides pantholopis]|uniref:tRNA lysidine(34) synthetase TilS n=1 Tax=Nocardioides pantholopis TaxID=2483798 RepID=UPI000F08BA12|nr:tRNA lysidine(34) synthetase TilS [Nocardioides pantholopis]